MKIIAKQKEKLIKLLIHNIQGMSFGSAQKSIRLGKIKVNGKKTKDNIEINIGDEIDIYEFKRSIPNVSVIYKDNNILIVNKPYGIECATRDKSSENTYSLEEIFAEDNAIVIHRLDRLTEGLVILARSKDIAKQFEEYFRTRQISKYYKACVSGEMTNTGIHKAYLKKSSANSLVEISNIEKDDYKEIITEILHTESKSQYSLLDIKLHTGRTHQIRAHLAHLGHGILGDNKYNPNSIILDQEYKGYYLTAYKLEFHLNGTLSYLNNIHIEIQPTWLQRLKAQ